MTEHSGTGRSAGSAAAIAQLRALADPFQALARQRGRLFPWAAVVFGTGIGIYFALPTEPDGRDYAILGAVAVMLLVAALVLPEFYTPAVTAGFLVASGILVAGFHAWSERAPVLGYRYYGPVEGRVVAVDRSLSNKLRVTMDQVVLENTSPDRTPERVRISLHNDADPAINGFPPPHPGQHLILTANLSPPQGPPEPGGFDFRRYAWFQQLGGVGYTRTPVLRIGPDLNSGLTVRINTFRSFVSGYIRGRFTGEAGGFAAAVTTGDRSGMSRSTIDALRASNLAHLLAISGLHMGLLTGFVFAALRYGIAAFPGFALRRPVKKIAAVCAMVVGCAYLAMSGGNVATVRAFIMVTVMFVAILTGRRALTLNAVALAVFIILLREPEALVGPGFQMSFAATAALVFVFGSLGARVTTGPRWIRPVLSVIVSSFVAGMATAPIGAAHFNQVAQYGLLANVLSVPVMGFLVVPAGVLAVLLAPFGLDWIGFAGMDWGIRWILGVAHWVAQKEGAVWNVVTPGGMVLPLICLGGLTLILWNGAARFSGLVAIAAGFFLWAGTERPLLLIADSGRLMGILTGEGRALSKPRGDGFVARSWLENDGDKAAQAEAAARSGFQFGRGAVFTEISGQRIYLLGGRGAGDRIAGLCVGQNWVIYAGDRPQDVSGCRFFGVKELRRSGALSLHEGPEGPVTESANENAGHRIWTPGR